MSAKKIQRLAILQNVQDHRITQVRTTEILNLPNCQITRLLPRLLSYFIFQNVRSDACHKLIQLKQPVIIENQYLSSVLAYIQKRLTDEI